MSTNIKNSKNRVLYLLAIMFMMAILFQIAGSKSVNAQWLYYPANAISLYGTPSIVISPPIPTEVGIPPFNLYYPAIGAPPAVLVPPPIPSNIAASVTPVTSTLLSRIALTTINPVAATSIFSLLSSLSPVVPAVLPNVYNLFYSAVTSPPGIPVLPPPAL